MGRLRGMSADSSVKLNVGRNTFVVPIAEVLALKEIVCASTQPGVGDHHVMVDLPFAVRVKIVFLLIRFLRVVLVHFYLKLPPSLELLPSLDNNKKVSHVLLQDVIALKAIIGNVFKTLDAGLHGWIPTTTKVVPSENP